MLDPTTWPPLPTPKARAPLKPGSAPTSKAVPAPDVVNDPHVSGRVVRIDAEPYDPARIIDAERRDKKASGRRRLRDDRRGAAAINHPLLKAPAIHRSDRHA